MLGDGCSAESTCNRRPEEAGGVAPADRLKVSVRQPQILEHGYRAVQRHPDRRRAVPEQERFDQRTPVRQVWSRQRSTKRVIVCPSESRRADRRHLLVAMGRLAETLGSDAVFDSFGLISLPLV